ncbi:MAG TPA: hypothetical protein VNT79_15425, partial [Phycisphaerae bacterium]|nr:hypothetical protein [Phycisphaerae bacterium]
MKSFKSLSLLSMCGLVFAAGGMAATGGRCDPSTFPPDNENSSGCGSGRPAILLSITTDNGDIVARSRVSVRRNGGAVSVGGCHEDFPCEEFPIGINLFGRFDIEVAPAGYAIESRTVNVGSSDNCNPTTEDVIIVVTPDATVAALAGAWRTTNNFGTTDIRFGDDGEIIGAIQYDRQVEGDGNFYIAYNNRD